MKISDFVFQFPTSGLGRHDALCRVRIFLGANRKVVSVLTDLADMNPGSSVTNSVEHIHKALVDRGFIGDGALILEHYDHEWLGGQTFDWVRCNNGARTEWQRAEAQEVFAALDCDESEFSCPSLEVKNIFDAVQRMRHQLDPHIGEPLPESFDVINRREDIARQMVPMSALWDAVNRGAGERALQSLIESDLSLLGDFYSAPKEEYVAIAQFPLDGGYVDFAVLSGRSRMEVTLIEIKGSDYKLINGNSYQDFSAKTNQAVQQIRRRLGYVTRNYEAFRKHVHTLREAAERNGEGLVALVGPHGCLRVDPDKDVNIHTVVIGGRSVDDLNESRLRHEYERGNSPSIRVESWDSWLKKVPR
ncbi:Shedu immune nuclease family protein [Algiphilus sp.]|uniref:Shedu immune nuclease family protein n=1 Tax=Algiphilus sp. TaxID=1872431 RepID=UPI003B529DB1